MENFSAIASMRREMRDLFESGFLVDAQSKIEYFNTARKIQRLFDAKDVAGLDQISEDNETYTAAEQRVADLAGYILREQMEE